MADSYICPHCGQPSYTKSGADEKEPVFEEKKAEKTQSAIVAAENPARGAAPDFGKELKSVTMTAGNALEETQKSKKLIIGFSVVAVALIILTAVMCLNIKTKIDNLENANAELKTAIAALKTDKAAAPAEPAAPTAQEPEKADGSKDEAFIIHTVKPGENLIQICNDYGVDYYANRSIIAAVNGLNNSSVINAGQKIIIPKFLVG